MTGLSQSASPLSVSSLAQLTLSLVAIVGLIFAISWVLKRLKVSAPRGGRGQIAVLDELNLGARERVVLLRPLTFMNDSGRSVQPAMAFFKGVGGSSRRAGRSICS